MHRQALLAAAVVFLVSAASASELPPREVPPSFKTGPVDRADIVVKSVRLTDNGDNDGFADPNETVSLYVTLRNSSGADRDGIVVTVATTDPTVDCIPVPVLAFGSLLAGQERESTSTATFRVANVTRSDPSQSLTATFDFQISGNDFGGTVRAQQLTVDLDLNVSGGVLPSTYTEGFEAGTFGSFTTQSLDIGKASLALSDGHRCQYNDPDFPNSNSYGNTYCFLGFPDANQNGYDWHVHGLGSPDGGRAYLGNNSLHWGMHPGAASTDTTRLKQLDAIRTTNTINLGWNGVTPVLSFKHQIGLVDTDYGDFGWDQAADRGVVQLQLANSSGSAVGTWRNIDPYENVYDMAVHDGLRKNCMFDPTDDGNTEDTYFDPTDPERRLGPSSTCAPEFVFTHLGATFWNSTFDPTDIRHASDGPGLQGALGPGTWVQSKFDLSRYRGRRLRLRFLVSTIEIANAVTTEQALNWGPDRTEVDDGWYIDDIQVTNTVVSAATVSVDAADRSALPACGPVCASVTASLIATPPTTGGPDEVVTLDASGSAPDQCPGGTLHYRFWRGLYGPFVLQEWGPGAVATAVQNATSSYGVDVRCSTRPACAGSATVVVPLVCSSIEPVPFPSPITWTSKTVVDWINNEYVDAIRGDLDALRESKGQFEGTVQLCLLDDESTSSFMDVTLPSSGHGFYYLVKLVYTPVVCRVVTWSSGSPAEVAGQGGNRDADIPLDPDTCP